MDRGGAGRGVFLVDGSFIFGVEKIIKRAKGMDRETDRKRIKEKEIDR